MSRTLEEAQRKHITALIDAVLEVELGYQCGFAIVWVKAGVAPTEASFGTNAERAGAIQLMQGMIDALEGLPR